jgi:hypothetical protein
LSSDHQVLVWLLSQSSPTTIPRSSWSQQGRAVMLSCPPENVIAYAVAYNGAWLGSHPVSPELVEFVALINTVEDWPNLARWLQWWRLPLLDEHVREALSRRIRKEPLETFLAWFSENEDFALKAMRFSHPNWQIVMRELFWNWKPSPAQSSEILRQTGSLSGDPRKDILEGWKSLSELVAINPVLSAAIVIKGLPILYPSASPIECRSLCMIACNEIAGLPKQAADLPRFKQSLISEAARQMKVDRSFIEKGLFREALELYNGEQRTALNLRVALAVQPLRQWLAIQLIEQHCRVIYDRA